MKKLLLFLVLIIAVGCSIEHSYVINTDKESVSRKNDTIVKTKSTRVHTEGSSVTKFKKILL